MPVHQICYTFEIFHLIPSIYFLTFPLINAWIPQTRINTGENKKTLEISRVFSEATTRFELVIRVLQTHALPLGYVALALLYYSKWIFIRQYKNSMTPTRIELVLPPWKGDVLTAWPRSLIKFTPLSINCGLIEKLPELGSNQQPFG